jgi:hypothetical protein
MREFFSGAHSKFVRNLVVVLLFCIAPASFAQLHPPRVGAQGQAPVICTGCPGINKSGQLNDGLPTYPYSSPIVGHTGRYVDSSNTQQFQNIGFRTARAQLIRIAKNRRGAAPPRAYIQIGSALAAYSLDSLFSTKLPGGMVSIASIMRGVGGVGRTPPENILKWDQYVYAEVPRNGWRCPFQDGQDRLADFDYDDRGYVYLAYKVFGWGIVSDEGKTDGKQMPKVSQLIAGGNDGQPDKYPNTFNDTSIVRSPETIVVYKSGAKYYAIVTDKVRSTAIWNVTNPAAPTLVKNLNGEKYAMRKWERDDATRRLAYIDSRNILHIYDYEAYIQGTAPIVDRTAVTGKFSDVTFDQGNVWAFESKNNLWNFIASGSGYLPQMYTAFASFDDIKAIHVANGFLMVAGTERTSVYNDVRLLKILPAGLRLINIDEFFRKYYHSAPSGYAEPGKYANIQCDVQVVPWNGKTYIFYSVFGLGDVFEISG